MTYYDDLTEYSYWTRVSGGNRGEQALNVGWLDGAHPFRTGTLPLKLGERLLELCRRPCNLTRGFHVCTVCPPADRDEHRVRWTALTGTMIGNGEIRVTGPSGSLYAAPTLIVHYTHEHNYLPPRDFVEGVLARR
ncbi:hypothetical protein [Nocardia sp. NPDC052566]|uniref:DUF7919 family protein n=1 Tax=Nocardia sp. NPDC052566 TaxID=3364330 RepID=UPI0037C8544A